MGKKKPTKKKATKKPKPEKPMSDGFGHLTIKKNWVVSGSSSVQGGEDCRPESQKCWEDYEWE
jgi:hypothetical protein